jgi:hypothetical protein
LPLQSGGGNDIAGDEFAILLNHAASTLPALNDDTVRGVIEVRLKAAYAPMIRGLTAIAQSYLNRPIPIITHGYDYALPDGRGFMGGLRLLPGPWLEPGFRKKEHTDFGRNIAVAAHRSVQRDAGGGKRYPSVLPRSLSGSSQHAQARPLIQEILGKRAASNRRGLWSSKSSPT